MPASVSRTADLGEAFEFGLDRTELAQALYFTLTNFPFLFTMFL